MREGTTSRVTVADRPYGEFYDFYSISLENFGYHIVLLSQSPPCTHQLQRPDVAFFKPVSAYYISYIYIYIYIYKHHLQRVPGNVCRHSTSHHWRV